MGKRTVLEIHRYLVLDQIWYSKRSESQLMERFIEKIDQ